MQASVLNERRKLKLEAIEKHFREFDPAPYRDSVTKLRKQIDDEKVSTLAKRLLEGNCPLDADIVKFVHHVDTNWGATRDRHGRKQPSQKIRGKNDVMHYLYKESPRKAFVARFRAVLQTVRAAIIRERPEVVYGAVWKLTEGSDEYRQVGISYASKYFRILFPDLVSVYDSTVAKSLRDGPKIKMWLNEPDFCLFETAVLAAAREKRCRPADVEQAYFLSLRQVSTPTPSDHPYCSA